MISSQLLDAGQALTIQSFQTRHLRTSSLVSPAGSKQTSSNSVQPQTAGSSMASLEKLHAQKKTAQSAIGALDQIKESLSDTQSLLVQNQKGGVPIESLTSIDHQKNAMIQVQSDLESLRGQVQNDANEKAIFTALEKVVNESVQFYEDIDSGMSFSKAMDQLKALNLSALSSQAQIEKIQNQLEASTHQVIQLASSYEASLFEPSNPFEVAEQLYGLSFQNPTSSVAQVGGVLDLVT